MKKERHYTVGQFAAMIDVHVKTLQLWDRQGTFKARRTPTDRRYYTDEDYENYRKGVRNDAIKRKD
jgi:DNA-binding transcriptional MerR regulator